MLLSTHQYPKPENLLNAIFSQNLHSTGLCFQHMFQLEKQVLHMNKFLRRRQFPQIHHICRVSQLEIKFGLSQPRRTVCKTG